MNIGGGQTLNKVEPIRDKEDIAKIKEILKIKNYRDYLLFSIGINTGFRISDILRLKVADTRDKKHIEIKEKKTGKFKKSFINAELKMDLNSYIQNKPDWEYLFKSREGDNQPISRVQAYRILKSAGKEIGLDKIGTHTLRKTFGYWHYKEYKDVALLQRILNHSAPSVTLDYIGINQEEIDESMEGFYL